MRELVPLNEIKIKKMRADCWMPHKTHEGDAGFDVFSTETFYLAPLSWYKVPLGFAIELPHGWVAIVSERSGMASRSAIMTIGNIIDSTYRGEVHAILYNGNSIMQYDVNAGDKIAQMLILPCYTGTRLRLMNKLSDTERGEKGFGSTDEKENS